MFNSIRRIHLIGIGGTGMSGIAEVLLDFGYTVSGSDTKDSSIISRLKTLGARINIGHSADALGDAQVVVVSSAINQKNPEIIAAQTRRIPIIHRSEMLAELMRLKHGVVVAGTHGKTTTTSLIGSALTKAGLDPTVVIGGRVNAFGANAKVGKGELFVAEADESDGSFLRLTPTVAVVTNIDRDHMDHFKDLDEIVDAFRQFLDRVPFYGYICACSDDPVVQQILPSLRRNVITYGFRPDAHVSATNVRSDGFSMRFSPVIRGKEYPEVTLKMPGRHNVSNALAAYAVALAIELDPSVVHDGLCSFEGVLHRSTLVGTWKNSLIVDDYAHNPKKIAAALKGMREAFPEKHLCAVFQPHRYSRLQHLGDELSRSFSDANSVIITPIYSAGEAPVPGITVEHVAEQIRLNSFPNAHAEIVVAADLKDSAIRAAEKVRKETAKQGCVILTMGAGDVANVGSWILDNLKEER